MSRMPVSSASIEAKRFSDRVIVDLSGECDACGKAIADVARFPISSTQPRLEFAICKECLKAAADLVAYAAGAAKRNPR